MHRASPNGEAKQYPWRSVCHYREIWLILSNLQKVSLGREQTTKAAEQNKQMLEENYKSSTEKACSPSSGPRYDQMTSSNNGKSEESRLSVVTIVRCNL